jgi:hypothetical protein
MIIRDLNIREIYALKRIRSDGDIEFICYRRSKEQIFREWKKREENTVIVILNCTVSEEIK